MVDLFFTITFIFLRKNKQNNRHCVDMLHHHFHGLYSYIPQLLTDQRPRIRSVIVKYVNKIILKYMYVSLISVVINYKVNTLWLIDFFVLAVRNISTVCTACEGPKSYNFTRSFENSLNPCNVCVRLCKPLNLGQGMKFAHCIHVGSFQHWHYIKLKNKDKQYNIGSYSKVFLHKDNPWFWSKL